MSTTLPSLPDGGQATPSADVFLGYRVRLSTFSESPYWEAMCTCHLEDAFATSGLIAFAYLCNPKVSPRSPRDGRNNCPADDFNLSGFVGGVVAGSCEKQRLSIRLDR